MSDDTFTGPWKTTGPWHHESGYPQTWSVENAYRMLCSCPTERGAELVLEALGFLQAERDYGRREA